ncbi:hypothetical protein V2I01_08105 [Micromonospora sp. BRA006-A]|nr:hypothetical protein [Micromonospora sp. BRA006-A]
MSFSAVAQVFRVASSRPAGAGSPAARRWRRGRRAPPAGRGLVVAVAAGHDDQRHRGRGQQGESS